MSEVKLSGEFQPNVFLDFGNGKAYSNKWGQGFTLFPFKTTKEDEPEPLYIYAADEYGKLYKTEYTCPRSVMTIDPHGSANIKINVERTAIAIKTKTNIASGGIYDYFNEEYIVNLRNAGVNYFTKSPKGVEDLFTDVSIRPSIVFMPQVRPTIKGGIEYGEVYDIPDGELFTIAVLGEGRWTGRPIMLCADKRLFLPESYYEIYQGDWYLNEYRFQPDENVVYYDNNGNKLETIDDCSAKFRVNGEFVSTIFVTYGAIVCLRTVTDYIDIDGVPTKVTYWEVDNGITLKRLDSGNGRLFFTDKYENYAEVQLPSPMYYSNNVIIDDDYEMEIEINTLNNDIFENSIMVNEYI